MNFDPLFMNMPWFGWIAIVAIISGSISGVIKMVLTHNERIEMIRQGMNPDAISESQKTTIREL